MKLLIPLILASIAHAQPAIYSYSKSTVLAGAGEKITLQQPASLAKRVKVRAVSVYCSVACTVTLSRDGTAATTTAGTAVAVSADYGTAATTVFHTSNVGAGTTLGTSAVPAGSTVTYDTFGWELNTASTARNYSVAVGSLTGTVILTMTWSEE